MDDLIRRARKATASKEAIAAPLWRQVADRHSNDVTVLREAASALVELKAADDAEAVIGSAVALFPDDVALLFDFARSAALGQRTQDEIARWQVFRTRFPENVAGYLGGCRAARKAGKAAEAEDIVADGLVVAGDDPRLLVEHAICAEAQAKWEHAITRWRAAEKSGASDDRLFSGLGLALIRSGRIDEAEAKLIKGATIYPQGIEIKTALAEVSTAREQWGEALKQWHKLLQEHPKNQRIIDGYGAALWRYKVNTEGSDDGSDPLLNTFSSAGNADDLERPVDVGLVQDDRIRELMMRFESLGQDCEFGLVQRHFGAEPLSMLRWTTTKPNTLLNGLRRKFEGVGEPANTEIDIKKSEIMVNERSSSIRFHTFIQRSPDLDLEKFRIKQARHLAYLKRMFLDRLDMNEKIYVYKVETDCSMDQIELIYAEMQKFSDITLLIVQRAGDGCSPGSVRHLRDKLHIGYLRHYGLDFGSAWKIAFNDWISLCESVAMNYASR